PVPGADTAWHCLDVQLADHGTHAPGVFEKLDRNAAPRVYEMDTIKRRAEADLDGLIDDLDRLRQRGNLAGAAEGIIALRGLYPSEFAAGSARGARADVIDGAMVSLPIL